MIVTVDRIEEDFAVVELPDKTIINLPMILFPNAKDGDVIRIEIDEQATIQRKKEISNLVQDLWE